MTGKAPKCWSASASGDVRCYRARKGDAHGEVFKAFRTLANPDKRDRAMETYVQARDKVEYSWKKRNKAAKKDGQLDAQWVEQHRPKRPEVRDCG